MRFSKWSAASSKATNRLLCAAAGLQGQAAVQMDRAVGAEATAGLHHGHLAGVASVEVFADRFAYPRGDAGSKRIADFHMLARNAQGHRKLTFLLRISARPEFIPAAAGYKTSGVQSAVFSLEL
jgi:hypothetical protein